MNCQHLTFSADNYIESNDVVLTSVPPSVTDINLLKFADAAKVAKWSNLDSNIVIEGKLTEQALVDYFSIPDSNLNPNASIRLELFENIGDTVAVYDSGVVTVGEIIPLGAWRAGIDPFGDSNNQPLNSVRTFILDELLLVQCFRLTIEHGFIYVPPTTTTTTTPIITTATISDGIFRQDATGVLSVEAESGDVVSTGIDTWATVSDAAASGGTALFKNQNDFYWNPNEGPRIRIEFTASQAGNSDVWLRLRSTDGNSLYAIFDGNSRTHIRPGAAYGANWTWYNVRNITTIAEQRHILTIAARDHFVYLDKVVIQPAGTAAPTGAGPAESGTGTTTETTTTIGTETTVTSINSSDSVQIRMLMMGNSLRMQHNFSYGSEITFLTEPDLRVTHSGRGITARPQRKARRLMLPMNLMTESDRLNLWQLETRLLGRPFLISAYPGRAGWFSGNYMFLAKFTKSLKYMHRSNIYHNTNIEVIEA